jgi:hypothetical protein
MLKVVLLWPLKLPEGRERVHKDAVRPGVTEGIVSRDSFWEWQRGASPLPRFHASRRRYPTREFRSFAAVMRQYVQATREDEMLHRNAVKAAHGLVEYLQCESKRVPDEVLLEAERLERLLFLGYDPHFDGDEPPGL